MPCRIVSTLDFRFRASEFPHPGGLGRPDTPALGNKDVCSLFVPAMLDDMIRTASLRSPTDDLRSVPWRHVPRDVRMLLCRIDAGFPSPAADDLEEPIDLAAFLVEHPAASYVMRVSGWSMVGANVSDGDYVVVDRAVRARPGHIVVALVHGDRTMKRLRRRDGRFWLAPEPGPGDVYPEIPVDEHVELWGVVVGLARRYR